MPYTKEHKAATRARILASARSLFNRRGFADVTIDEIMAKAKLTRGGFYNHFGSKEELYAESVRSFTQCNPFMRRLAKQKSPLSAPALARMVVNLYLSDEVLDDVDQQCPLYALPNDVARAGRAPRHAYTDLIRSMTLLYQRAFSPTDRRAAHKAQLIVSLCVGGMVLARTTNDPKLRASLRAAARKQALSLLPSAPRASHRPRASAQSGRT